MNCGAEGSKQCLDDVVVEAPVDRRIGSASVAIALDLGNGAVSFETTAPLW